MEISELDKALGCIVARIEQINTEQEPEHWLWDRVIECDIPRLRELMSEEALSVLDEGLREENMANSETPLSKDCHVQEPSSPDQIRQD